MNTTCKTQVHLPFLDGIRGLAALYVVGFHAYSTSDSSILGWDHTLPRLLSCALRWLDHGQLAVDVFIVLSGFCLMMPVALDPNHTLRGGFWKYMKRRARRILPPYFGALLVAIICIRLLPGLSAKANVYWDSALPAFSAGALISHLFLVHNLIPSLASKIDYPLWSVATEWQIYPFLPLLILPLWRNVGLAVAISGTIAFSLFLHYAFPSQLNRACPHFLGLFALGSLGAVLGVGNRDPGSRINRCPWGVLAALVGIPVLLAMQFMHEFMIVQWFLMDWITGIATMLLLVWGARRDPHPARTHPLIGFLETPFILWLGAISYSLYLIHALVLAELHVITRSYHFNSTKTLGAMFFIGMPSAILLAWAFHYLFEKPFLVRRGRVEVALPTALAESAESLT